MDNQTASLRWASYRIHQSLVQKPLKIEEFWPLWGDKKKDDQKIVMTKEMYDQIKQIHKLT